MTNKEKFKEIFGYEASTGECPIYCYTTDGDECCPYCKTTCSAGDWWDEEYKESRGIPVSEKLDKIRAEIVELWQNEPCAIEGGCLDEILEIIDKEKK